MHATVEAHVNNYNLKGAAAKSKKNTDYMEENEYNGSAEVLRKA